MRTFELALSWMLIGALWMPPETGAQEVTYYGGAQYAGGTYIFEERTDAFYVSNGIRLEAGRLEFGASIPIIIQNGGLVTQVAGGVPLPTGGTQGAAVAGRSKGSTLGTRRGRTSGTADLLPPAFAVVAVDDSATILFDDEFSTHVGDPTFDVASQLYSGFGLVRSLRVSVNAKAPLTDLESGVGSGEWDYGVGGSVVAGKGRALFFGDVSYWWFGDLPDLELADGISYGLGASTSVFSGRGSVLFALSGMSRTIETMDRPLSVALSVSHSVGDSGFLSAGGGIGLTEASPDAFFQIGWSVRR